MLGRVTPTSVDGRCDAVGGDARDTPKTMSPTTRPTNLSTTLMRVLARQKRKVQQVVPRSSTGRPRLDREPSPLCPQVRAQRALEIRARGPYRRRTGVEPD